MSKLSKIVLIVQVMMSCSSLHAAHVSDVIDQARKVALPSSSQGLFTTFFDEKKSKRAELEQELQKFKEKEKAFQDATNDRIEVLKGQTEAVKDALRHAPDNAFLEKKLAVLNENYRIPKEQKKLYEKILGDLEKNIKLHDAYLADSNFKSFEKDLGVEGRETFTLEQFQDISQKIQDQERILGQLNEQKKSIQLDLENRKQALTAINEQSHAKVGAVQEFFELDARQHEELTALTDRLEQDQKAFYELRKREAETHKELVKMEIFLAEAHIDRLRQALRAIKPFIKVSEATIALARDELAKRRQVFFDAQETYDQRVELTLQRQKELEKVLDSLVEQTSIPLGPDLDDWSREPSQSAQGYLELFEVAGFNTNILLLHRQREFIEAQRALADRILKDEAVYLDVKSTFQKILSHKLASEEIALEKKEYEAPKSRVKTDLLTFAAQKTEAENHLERQKKALANIALKRQALRAQRGVLFKQKMQEYTRCLEFINDAEAKIKRNIDLTGRLVSLYNDILGVLTKTLKHIDFILSELETEAMWGRSELAISWDGIKNVWPNIVTFVFDVRTYLASMRLQHITHWFSDIKEQPLHALLFIAIFVVLLGFLALVRRLLYAVTSVLVRVNERQPLLRAISLLIALMLEFAARYFVPLALWVTVLALLNMYSLLDPYPHIVFYLLSIPYLLYIAYRFVQHVKNFNVRYNYVFLSPDLQQRFLVVLATLMYSSISILLFREAFILGAYHTSELPAILLAVNVIVIQIALIFLLAKIIEQIVAALPSTNERLQWLRLRLDQYHYLILVFLSALMIMGNPYVGFGRLVLHLLSRSLLTAGVVLLFFAIYRLLKYLSSHVFFYSEHSIVRERFSYGKTWYGLFIITIFVASIVLSAVFIAKIWGWPEQLAAISKGSDIIAWLRTPIMFEKTAEAPISVFSMLQVIGFILAGFIIAFIINYFVLERVFDVLVVESGAQNAITSITQYVVIAFATIVGFQAVGRGDLVVWVIGALVLGIGWVIKDPVGDFIAYFIILVQRPVKIGDFIKLDADTIGVVRKITVRCVVIRRKNSTMIIIPNMTIITKPLVNWNYQRGFIAFDDIIIRVSYKDDPQLVKSLLERVLEDNSFVLKSPRPIVRLDEFDEFGFMFMARGFISSNYTLDQWDIASDIRLAMVRELRKHGIHIAVPTRLILDHESSQRFMQQETPTSGADRGPDNTK